MGDDYYMEDDDAATQRLMQKDGVLTSVNNFLNAPVMTQTQRRAYDEAREYMAANHSVILGQNALDRARTIVQNIARSIVAGRGLRKRRTNRRTKRRTNRRTNRRTKRRTKRRTNRRTKRKKRKEDKRTNSNDTYYQ